MIKRSKTILLSTIFWLGLVGTACSDIGGGAKLKKQSFQFPVSLAVHSQGFALVVNSNFDLAYQSGSLRIIDLNRLADAVENGTAIDSDNTEFILDDESNDKSIGLSSFGGSIKLSEWQNGGLAVVAVRENNHLVFVNVTIKDDGSGNPDISLDCDQGDDSFALCDGAAHLLTFDRDDPFDVLLLDGEETDLGVERTAFVTFLRSGVIEAVQIPPGPGDVPRQEYQIETGVLGVNDLAYSPATGMVYATNRASMSRSNPINYFDPKLGMDTRIHRLDLFSTLLGYETRGVDFTPDGLTATVLVRSPNMLVFLDASIGSTGLPRNTYLGHVLVGNSPSRVRAHGDLLLVTCAEDDSVYIIDSGTRRLLDLREDICRGPYDIDFFDRGEHNWGLISCFEDDVVAVLDLNPDSDTFLDVIARVGKPRP